MSDVTPSTCVATSEAIETEQQLIPESQVPVMMICPASGWQAINFHELWRYRELLFFLTWRDIKVRYKQTVLGAAWAVIQPLFAMLVFTLFFGKLAKIPSDGIPYPVFSYAALLPWTYFANSLGAASASLVGNANLITKVYFPRLIIPGSAVIGGLMDYAVAFSALVFLMFWYGIPPSWTAIVSVPFLSALTAALALGVSLWLSALSVRFRDLRYVVPFMVQLWMFATPIVYPLSIVPPEYRWAAALNPMAGIIEAFRSTLFGRSWNLLALSISVGLALLLIVSGAFYFRRVEKTFADIV